MKNRFFFTALMLLSFGCACAQKMHIQACHINKIFERASLMQLRLTDEDHMKITQKSCDMIEIEEEKIFDGMARNLQFVHTLIGAHYLSPEIKKNREKLTEFLTEQFVGLLRKNPENTVYIVFDTEKANDILLPMFIIQKYITPEKLPKFFDSLAKVLCSQNKKETQPSHTEKEIVPSKKIPWIAEDLAKIFEGEALDSLGLTPEEKNRVKSKSHKKIYIEEEKLIEGMVRNPELREIISQAVCAPFTIKNYLAKLKDYLNKLYVEKFELEASKLTYNNYNCFVNNMIQYITPKTLPQFTSALAKILSTENSPREEEVAQPNLSYLYDEKCQLTPLERGAQENTYDAFVCDMIQFYILQLDKDVPIEFDAAQNFKKIVFNHYKDPQQLKWIMQSIENIENGIEVNTSKKYLYGLLNNPQDILSNIESKKMDAQLLKKYKNYECVLKNYLDELEKKQQESKSITYTTMKEWIRPITDIAQYMSQKTFNKVYCDLPFNDEKEVNKKFVELHRNLHVNILRIMTNEPTMLDLWDVCDALHRDITLLIKVYANKDTTKNLFQPKK